MQTEQDPFLENYILSLESNKLLSYDFICCISGDGSAHSILNGFYKKNLDFNKDKLRLVMIPAGSGCLLFENSIKKGEFKDFSFENAIYVICHPQIQEM